MSQHDWEEINRSISESIEPKPKNHPRGLGRINVAWTFSDELEWRSGTNRMVGWQPRDWREPAAAMELLKRLTEGKPFDGWEEVMVHLNELNTTLEEAIVLSYRNTIKFHAR